MTDTSTITDPGKTGGAEQSTTTPWYGSADAETVGYLQNRGWDKIDAPTAALNAIKAHREAEKHLGVPVDRLIRLPKDANDVQAHADMAMKLGVPSDGKYDFTAVKFADGSDLDDSFIAALSPALRSANVSKSAAASVAQAVVKFMDDAAKSEGAEVEANLAAEKDTLTSNWGSRANANMIIAKNAAAALGVKPEEVAALEKVVGYARVMEMFRTVGEKIGEDKFVTADNVGGGRGPMTKEQAVATLAEKKSDPVWAKKLMEGDRETLREMHNLTQMMQG